MEEDIINGDYSRSVNDRIEKKEYNGDVYKIRSILRNIEIDIKDDNIIDDHYMIINEIYFYIIFIFENSKHCET